MNEQAKDQLEQDLAQQDLGQRIVSIQEASGGDINNAYLVRLDDGREIFVKTNETAPTGMFSCEAQGLTWLKETETLPTPEILGFCSEGDSASHYLALEFLKPGPAASDFDERLGDGLAKLHQHEANEIGLGYNNFIATLDQDNSPQSTWPEFYSHSRLEPLVKLAVDSKAAPIAWASRFERLFYRMPNLAGTNEPPSRLHGDLWSGNIHIGQNGCPYLIDPAVYGGNREMDLAMLSLFGGLNETMLSAYDNRHPREPDYSERVGLYQIYPLLVHANLFGGRYPDAVSDQLSRYL